MKITLPLLSLALGLSISLPTGTALAQGTAFTYQGRLDSGGAPYNGSAEFQATLWDAATSGSQVAANNPTAVVVGVTNGLFTLPLDFGANFPGANRWLQLEVRTSIGSFTTLTPRQTLTPTPYALTAAGLSGSLPAAQLSGAIANANLPASPTFAGTVVASTFSGNGANLTNVNAVTLNGLNSASFWRATGNAGTTPGNQFIGTTDDQPLEFKVNGIRALRLEPGTMIDGAPNVIGGSPRNFVAPGVIGATIAGGGATNYYGSVLPNSVRADFGAIGGGLQNTIQPNADNSTISGGNYNTIQPNANSSTIGGGYNNTIQTDAEAATIGGGWANTIQNIAGYATIGGGRNNTIQTNAYYATIGGGYWNTIQANAAYATIPGGRDNSAVSYAFAAGYRAKANHSGSFVWADSQNADFVSTDLNQFAVRAGGGLRLDDSTSLFFGARVRQMLNLWSTSFGIGVQDANMYFRVNPGAGYAWYRGGAHQDGHFDSGGGTQLMRLESNGSLYTLGVVNPPSDRNLKENFRAVDAQAVLAKVAVLPLTRWNYKTSPGEEHVGPMAQDFHAAFGLGTDDKHIATVDADGVALAAIQGLNQKLEETRAENVELRQTVNELKILVQSLNQQLNANQP
ncbi:MAG: tail fiber domain-containing protein [Verrucomicrobiae bacterium]|nr:tail fiber domain-containing protein [Verrucomicrobiae bacterium]